MVGRLSALFLVFMSGMICCAKRGDIYHTTFTKADSLTDTYLALHDSVLRSWNMMIHDDNQKIKAMHNLLHELQVTSSLDTFNVYEEKIDQLKGLRYDEESMSDPKLIEQYDEASRQLTSELISISESRPEFHYNPTLQKLVQEIRVAEQRIALFKSEYDVITKRFNTFLRANKSYLSDVGAKDSLEIRPLFQSSASD
jgi:hypothetical protein